ncbi:hypothetical protein [Paraglaciecola sp.]|uniref:hypothetical protein n=1 Tax=Paraglaciecola sp. TaxID=1920173 RepID=UPI0030F47DB2
MLQFYGGVDLKISLLYKLPLVACMLVIIALKSRTILLLIILAFIVLILGPAFKFTSNHKVAFLFNDISLAIKVITPFITFYFCKTIAKIYPDILGTYGIRALWINFLAILFNLVIGVLGFGYPSYDDGGEDGQGIGVNGFYIAGNELSGCFVLLFGFILHYFWNYQRFYFYPFSLLTIVCGALIATKTAMLASFMLIFLVPIVNERQYLFHFTKLKVKLFFPLVIGCALATYFILDFLKTVGLHDKIVWVLQEKGILDLIFSGRLELVSKILDSFMSGASWFEYLFGIGTIGMSGYFTTKYSSEVDPIDLFVYVGVLGSLIVYISVFIMILPAFLMSKKDRFLPPIIVLVNLILLVLCFFSGHILNSGMLGPIWGLINGMIFVKMSPLKQQ